MNNEYNESESEPEMNIINFIKICRFCDNIKKKRSLTLYRTGLENLKICMNCRNDIIDIKNDFFVRRLFRLNRLLKIKQSKKNIVIVLHRLKIGIKGGIHQNILEYLI